MSRVHWSSRERTADLRGSERAWLHHVAEGPARAAWDLEGLHDLLPRALKIMEMIPESSRRDGADYLYDAMRKAIEQDARNKAFYSRKPNDPWVAHPDREPVRQFLESLKIRLSGSGISDTIIRVAGHDLDAWSLCLNTAIAAGSAPIQLAARLHGQCELHCFVEGEDREWLAEVIQEGLDVGIYRKTLLYDGREEISQGWEDVLELLRERDDGPVVLSYSVSDDFPDIDIAKWAPDTSIVPEDYDSEKWETLDKEDRREISREQWYDLSDEERWDLSVLGLREQRPWARISPDTLGIGFYQGLTVYDVMAPDKEDRVRRAFEADEVETSAE